MLDKKTTRQIRQDYIKTNEAVLDILFPNKVWVSQESLLLLLQRYEDLGHDEGIIKCLKKDLKGEKG